MHVNWARALLKRICHFGSIFSSAPLWPAAASRRFGHRRRHLRVRIVKAVPFWPLAGAAMDQLAGGTPGELVVENALLSDESAGTVANH